MDEKEKTELLRQAVKLSEDLLKSFKSNPRIYDEEDIKLQEKELKLTKQLFDILKNS